MQLLSKRKKLYLPGLDAKRVTDNEIFWRTIKPLISNKVKIQPKITLVEKIKVLSHEKPFAGTIAGTVNIFLRNIDKKF